MLFRCMKGRTSRYLDSGASIFLWILVLALFLWEGSSLKAEESSATPRETVGSATGQVVVTYFHTTVRCPTCHRLEEYARETVKAAFARELEQGKIVFRVINVQEPENQHYIQDYRLYTKSLIVSEQKDEKEIRWKNLPEIWRLVRDRERYEQYVRTEIEDYLKDL